MDEIYPFQFRTLILVFHSSFILVRTLILFQFICILAKSCYSLFFFFFGHPSWCGGQISCKNRLLYVIPSRCEKFIACFYSCLFIDARAQKNPSQPSHSIPCIWANELLNCRTGMNSLEAFERWRPLKYFIKCILQTLFMGRFNQ